MLTSGQSTLIKFKVNVMGSSNEPKVRLILASSPELSFAAQSVGDGWESKVDVPASIAPGSYDFRVEVILNNRLFTPVNKKIDVAAPSVPDVIAAPEENVAVTAPPQGVGIPATEGVVIPAVENIVAAADGGETRALVSLLSDVTKVQPKRKFEAFSSGMPSGKAAVAAPAKIRISEIDAVTSKAVSKIVEVCSKAKSVTSTKKPKTPIRLIKEHIVYE